MNAPPPPPSAGCYPMRGGNDVRPLVDGVPALARIGAAVEAARHSVWVTVAFLAADFRMPGDLGSLWDMLDRVAARGVDVRLIIWRPTAESYTRTPTFPGLPEDLAMLRARGSQVRIRWDTVPGPFCHHQKCWLVDAGRDGEIAFVGGINLTAGANGVPGHDGTGQHHDLYAELAGPSACDVHHNFVQRWNGASERFADGGSWGDDGADMPYPTRPGAPRGTAMAQVQRMIPARHYTGRQASPGGSEFDIAAGERSILEQYLLAIDAARDCIYIENQAIPIVPVAERVKAALERGVEVVALVPGVPEAYMREARRLGTRAELFDALAGLSEHANFTLAAIAGRTEFGTRSDVYVHSKIMLVDDAWATIGSCNLHASSMGGHSELNLSFWDAAVVRSLRRTLLSEHLDADTGALDGREALRLFGRIAAENRRLRDAGDANWQGLAFRLDPDRYGA
jgi:cardiolipin synthase